MSILFNDNAIRSQILGCMQFIKTFTGYGSFPEIYNGNNNTPPDSFHDESLDQNFFPGAVTTSDSLLIFAKGCLNAFRNTGNNDYIVLAINTAIGFLYNCFTPQLNPPDNANTAPYWFFHSTFLNRGILHTMGSQHADYSYSFGYIKNINFVNGVGSVEFNLADVYQVYSGTLLFRNVHASIIPTSGIKYQIDHWISNGYSVTPLGVKTSTSAPNGQITLTQNYTGVLGVTYSLYDGQTVYGSINNNYFRIQELIELNPIWYSADYITNKGVYTNTNWESLWLAYDLFLGIFNTNNDSFWQKAAIAIQKIATDHPGINNQTYFFKKESSSDPFRYPGSSIFADPSSYIISREYSVSNLIYFLKAVLTGGVNKEFVFRNIIPEVNITESILFSCEIAADTIGIYYIKVSTSFNILDYSHEYVASVYITNIRQVQTIFLKPTDFIQWAGTTVWNSGNGINLKSNLNQQFILQTYLVQAIVFGQYALTTFVEAQNISDTASFTFNNCNYYYDPPNIVYYSIGSFNMVVTDINNNDWTAPIPNTKGVWNTLTLTWEQFGNNTPLQSNLTSIKIESVGTDLNYLGLYYLGNDPPLSLIIPSVVYKAEIVSNLPINHTIWIGDFKVTGNDLDNINYTPGVVPTGITSLNGNPTNFLLSSSFYSGQQSPYHWHIWNQLVNKNNVLDYLSDAQDEYRTISGFSSGGLLAPIYINSYWDSGEIGQFSKITTGKFVNSITYPLPMFFGKRSYKPATVYDFNFFTWTGFNPTSNKASYLFRAIEQTARLLFIEPTNTIARKIVTNFLKTTLYFHNLTQSNKPITDIPESGQPQANYDNPAVAAINGKIALYANMAGVDSDMTSQIIKNSFDYISSLYIDSGAMAGSWAKNQGTFTVNGIVLAKYFSSWIGQVLDFYSMLLQYENNIVLPFVSPYGVLPTFPVTRIENIKLANYPIQTLKFTDGNQQRISIAINNSQIGNSWTVVYENLTPYETRVFSSFYNDIGGIGGTFTLPVSVWQFETLGDAVWRLNEITKIETKVSSAKKGRFNISVSMERVN